MEHTAETLLPWKEYCHNLNHSKMVHISKAKMVCKCTLWCICLMDVVTSLNIITCEYKSYFLNTIKQVNFTFFLCLLNSFHCKNIIFQNKGFHFYYCNYCGGCLNGVTEENVQAHLNDCSQHSSKFICHECGMVSENFLWHMHFFLFSIQNLFYLFKTKFVKTIRIVSSDP